MHRKRQMSIAMKQGWPEPLNLKKYELKCKEIPIQEKYSDKLSDEYWSHWPENRPTVTPEPSWIDHNKLMERATKAGYNNKVKLEYVYKTLKEGAELGAKGSARLGSVKQNDGKPSNYATAYEHGALMADALCTWVKQGLVWGPMKEDQVPWPNPKVSPMSVELKPTGAARIIVDLSSPHLNTCDLGGSQPTSVNSGISIEEFPMEGVQTPDILKALVKLGKGQTYISKQDWSDAYKHLKVKSSDLRLQCVEWGGRLFTELALTFGGRSSPGIYHAVSEVILVVAILEAGLRRSMVKKQLDDVVAIASKAQVDRFYWQYRELCEYIGVRLAPEEDPSKCFPCSENGSILGLEYSLHDWTWTLSKKKAMKILSDCREIIEKGKVPVKTLKSLVGRIEFYKVLIPGGNWERGFLLKDASSSENLQKLVNCSANTISQTQYWARAISSSLDNPSHIPDPHVYVPMKSVDIYTDAAGVSASDFGLGLGGLMNIDNMTRYVYVQHSKLIRSAQNSCDGEAPGRKLSFLEAAAILATVSAFADRLRGNHITVWTDNIGVVWAFKKEHSRDLYCYTVMKALADVCRGMNIGLLVNKTPRCSGKSEVIADMLSKGKCIEAWSLMDYAPVLLEPPRTFYKFMQNPRPTRLLGKALLMEMREKYEVLPCEPELSYELQELLVNESRVEGLKWKKIH